MSLFRELSRRNVFRVAAAYVVLSWLLLQVVDVVAPILALPDWFARGVLLMLALGFLPALIFAWVYELTPEGLKRESEIDRSASITEGTGKRLDLAVIGLLVLAIGLSVGERLWFESSQPATAPESAHTAASSSPGAVDTKTRPSIAVLPFANRSNREEDQFFTDGIHDDLLSHLASIQSLKVISRTSVMRYRDTEKSIPEIARELGVSNILEGGIQRAGDQVRINMQLIDARSDEHLWAQIFDRRLTAENLFVIQSEISQAIADALRTTLSGEELARLERVPTRSLEAYQAYLLGRDRFQRRGDVGPQALTESIEHFHRAIEIEPDYAEAHAGLAASYLVLNGYLEVPDPRNPDRARESSERALDLSPGLSQASAVLGLYYSGPDERKWLLAQQYLLRSIEAEPSNASAHLWLAIVMFASGFVGEGNQLMATAVELDPTSGIVISWRAVGLELVGDLNGAIAATKTASQTGFQAAPLWSANLRLRQGDLEGAAADLKSVSDRYDVRPWLEIVVPAYRDPALKDEAVEAVMKSRDWAAPEAIAIMYLEGLGAYDEALGVIEDRIIPEGDLIVHAWRPDRPGIRTLPRFKALIESLNLPRYWRERGFPEFCRPLGEDDFECF